MAKQTINAGSGEYSGDGESIRIAFTKVNSNFTEVYTQVPLATTATYAQSFNTSTLVRAAVSATNVVNGTWTLSLSTAGSILINNVAFISGAGSATTSTLVNGANTVSLGTSGAVTLSIGLSIDQINGLHFPRIVADTGKAFSVQGYGSTGSVALQWAETASTSSQIAQVGLNKFGNDGLAKVTLTAGTSTNDMKVWGFAADGSLTFPDASVQTTAWTGASSITWPVINTAGASGPTKVAIGQNAGLTTQGVNAVAVGRIAGQLTQGEAAVAIGYGAGYTGQGAVAVAIGSLAGSTNQAANTIILNASGTAVNGVAAQIDSFYVAPIRNSGATSSYATKRVLQYNETTKEITYSNTLDAVRPYITGYSAEIHVSPVAVDDTGNGTIGDPVKTIARAQALAALAFETTAVGQRKSIILHPGDYVENVTISTQYTVLTTHELVGKNTTLSGTLTITKGCTIDGLKMTNLVISADNTTGSIDIIGCTVTTTATKTSTAYVSFRACDLSSSSLSITGAGSTVLVGGNYGTVTVNNAAAGVLAKAVVTMGPVTLTLGTLQLSDTLIYAATTTSNAITQGAGSVITLNNCQTLLPTLDNVARISFGGYYSILHSVYDKPNSTFGGVSLNSISYSQYINADRLILTPATPARSYGVAGDKAGMVVVDATYIYYCTANYVNTSTDIWKRTAHGAGSW